MSEPQWQTCPKCGERWWDSHVCRNTLNSLKIALAPTCQFCGQAARAQPAQVGQVLTDDFIKAEALEAFDCYWDADDETLVNKYGHGVYLWRFIDFARAIEAAVLAKRVPMTNEQITHAMRGSDPRTLTGNLFFDGIRTAERHHGIVGEKGGA